MSTLDTMVNTLTHDPLAQPKLQQAAERYQKPQELTYGYGTAGFRTLASRLPSVLFRVGLLAILRSKRLDGATIGIMITASHNPEQDNGVKLVDPSGEMLDASWEQHATLLANCASTSTLIQTLKDLISQLKIDINQPASIVFAKDTRPSGPELVEALQAALGAWDGVKVVDLGVTTTPILHYVVKATNDKTGGYGVPTVQGYMIKTAEAFKTLVANRPQISPLTVDCANGVGALALETLGQHLGPLLPFKALNTSLTTPGALNKDCGADYVKTSQHAPPSVASTLHGNPGVRACSFDGDADRIVYYYYDDAGRFRLLDGDKIAVMAAMWLMELVEKAKLNEGEDALTVGVVQTAYANGSSTKFLKSRNIPVTCVPTGVKHLHSAAHRFPIGVYFEANGHGTILFSHATLERLSSTSPHSPDGANAIAQLLALSHLINQAVGDAISDMLLVETILAFRRWGAPEWDAAYEDLPNRLLKVVVPNRGDFVATDAERRLERPKGLQGEIDETMRKFEMGRAFVRPSGTEDCVRVYTEAKTKAEADGLATAIADLVRYHSGAA